MVLDFGLIKSGLFPQSDAEGEGLGADIDPQIIQRDVGLKHWTLLQTILYSADATKTSAILPVYADYKVIVRLYAAGETELFMRINGDAGANYNNMYKNNVTDTWEANVTNIRLGTISHSVYAYGQVFVPGNTVPIVNGWLVVPIKMAGWGAAGRRTGVFASWKGGNNTQIATMTFWSTQNMTGQVEIFGR